MFLLKLSLIFIILSQSAEASISHEDFHRAIFLGIRIPASYEKKLLIEFGLISCLVVSGIHFQIAMKLGKKIKIPSLFLAPLSLGLAFLWNWNLPVMRAFLEYHFNDSSLLKNWVPSPYLAQAICFFLCLLFVNSSYDLHSLWLSFIFSFYFRSMNLNSLGKKILSTLGVFALTPFLLPFPSKLSAVSIPIQLIFMSLFIFFLFLSPLLHLYSDKLCQDSFNFIFQSLMALKNNLPYYHPLQSGGYNLCLIYFFLMLLLNVRRKKNLRKAFFKSQS